MKETVDDALDNLLGRYIQDPLELENVKEKIIAIITNMLYKELFGTKSGKFK